MDNEDEIKIIYSDGKIDNVIIDMLIEYRPNGIHFENGYLLYKDLFLKMIGFTSLEKISLKEKKVDIFMKRENIVEIIRPVAKIYINNQFEGYATKFILTKKEKKYNLSYFIYSIGILLKNLHNKNVIIGDLTFEKIQLDDAGNYYFLVIDDFGIDNLEPNIKNNFLKRNFKNFEIGKRTDIIMFKKMIAEIILNRNFHNYSYLYYKIMI